MKFGNDDIAYGKTVIEDEDRASKSVETDEEIE